MDDQEIVSVVEQSGPRHVDYRVPRSQDAGFTAPTTDFIEQGLGRPKGLDTVRHDAPEKAHSTQNGGESLTPRVGI